METVFVSHRGIDAAPAERLATQLRAAGYRVWIDVWEIGIGDSLVGSINRGLGLANFFVLCYSSAGVDSAWMAREWHAALALQLAGVDIRIFPIRLTAGDAPPILADIKYADLAGDWDRGVQQLLSALSRKAKTPI